MRYIKTSGKHLFLRMTSLWAGDRYSRVPYKHTPLCELKGRPMVARLQFTFTIKTSFLQGYNVKAQYDFN